MRITFIIQSLSVGGAQRVLSAIANYWAEKGHAVSILTFDNNSEKKFQNLNTAIEHKGLHISAASISLFRKLILALKIPFVLRKRILETNPEIVISFMDQANMFTVFSLIGTGVRAVVSERANPANSSIMDKKWPKFLRRVFSIFRNILYRRAVCFVAQTKGQASYFPKDIQEKAIIIPNPLSPRREASPDIKLPENTIIALGRLTWEKRFDVLIDAFNLVSKKHSDWKLAIVGEGALRVELESRIQSLGLGDKIILPGTTKTPYGVLEQGKIFVLSSESEGYPSVLIEAMSVGLPVIATDCPYGPSEIVNDGTDGILVPIGDVGALFRAISYLIENPEKRSNLGRNALENAKRFEISRVIKEWEALLENTQT